MNQEDGQDLIDGAPLWPRGPTSVMHLVRRAAQRTGTSWSAAVSSGLTQLQYAVLIVLDELGTCDQQTVGSRAGMDKATGTYVIDRMVQADLVQTHPDAANRRRKLITMTEAGRQLLAQTIVQAKVAEEKVVSRLSEAEQKTLIGLLSRLSGVKLLEGD